MSAVPARPVLVCYDGSAESHHALDTLQELLTPVELVILVVWQSLSTRLAGSGSFGVIAVSDDERLDSAERQAARQAAREAVARAEAIGYKATARVEEAQQEIWVKILEVAEEIDAALIVAGSRGRGALKSA